MGPASSARAELDLLDALILHFAEVEAFVFRVFPPLNGHRFPLVSP